METTTTETPSTVTIATASGGEGKERKDFLFVVGSCLFGCLLLQTFIGYCLLSGNPPDNSWELIKNLMSSITTIETGLMGGLLGMARSGGSR